MPTWSVYNGFTEKPFYPFFSHSLGIKKGETKLPLGVGENKSLP